MKISGGDLNPEDFLSGKVYYSFLSISFFWLLLVFLAPLFARAGGIFEDISSVIYIFFSKVCHQQEARSFHLFEHKLGVCSRCLWIYIGVFFGSLIYRLKYPLKNLTPPSLFYLVAASMLLAADVALDSLGIFPNTFLSRSVTGFLIGAALPFYLIPGFLRFFCEVFSYLRNRARA